jgi:hypothetical protein
LILKRYMVVSKCGVYNIGNWLLMLQNWQNIKAGYQ